MFLIAGLLGVFVSGALMFAPVGDDGPEDAPDPDGDASIGGDSPLTVATEGGGDDDAARVPAGALPPGTPEHLAQRLDTMRPDPIAFDTDAVTGGTSGGTYQGGDGDDLIIGNDGADAISGEDGRDELQGGRGNDDLDGGAGDDILLGEDGDDRIAGGAGADWAQGGAGDDTLDGGAGDDALIGGYGRDLLSGGDGDDILDGTITDTRGEAAQGDRLEGGAGDDTLAGGTGDRLTGGDGADLFLFRAPPVAFTDAGPAALPSAAADDGLAMDDGPPLIEDFDPGADLIEIAYGADDPVPDLTITRGPAGQEVRLDGEIVARVTGSAPIEAAHIRLVAWA
ncbi:calcium-binding protein [Jannaschia sp. KMU-145]|uniref:calcium-binding protein n=1 Tax=Jannaschia halovivens TaxID=3388667 RepID=UPI00396B18E9